jgi:hypothetical protein
MEDDEEQGTAQADTNTDDGKRSVQRCPACGEHRLAVVDQPRVDVGGVQPANELLGLGDLQAPPGITCLACGTRWLDATAFMNDRRLQPEKL